LSMLFLTSPTIAWSFLVWDVVNAFFIAFTTTGT
jgi:hypothetical protein